MIFKMKINVAAKNQNEKSSGLQYPRLLTTVCMDQSNVPSTNKIQPASQDLTVKFSIILQ